LSTGKPTSSPTLFTGHPLGGLPYRPAYAGGGYWQLAARTVLLYAARSAAVSPEAYLQATGALIDSQAAELLSAGQAELFHEQRRSAAIEAQRGLIDSYLEGRAAAPTVQDAREQAQQRELRRSMGDLTTAEVCSGAALNTLLAGAQRLHARGARGPDVPVTSEVLQAVSVTQGNSGGGGAVLRGGRPRWPAALAGDSYERERVRVEAALTAAVRQAKGGRVRLEALREVDDGLRSLRRAVARDAADLGGVRWRQAKHFLADLDSALQALQHPKAANYFNGTYAARGGNVFELVQHMTDNGLKFAPAAAGDEAAYRTLHAALASYVRGAEDPSTFAGPRMLRTGEPGAVYGIKRR
jgi:hypothetical protein